MSVQETKYKVFRQNLLYPELSFRTNKALFETYRQIGGDCQEKYIQKAVALSLHKEGLLFREQVYVPRTFDQVVIGKCFLDFLVENVIILELKRGKFVPYNVIDQTKKYLTALNLELGIIACFTANGVFPKRIINVKKFTQKIS